MDTEFGAHPEGACLFSVCVLSCYLSFVFIHLVNIIFVNIGIHSSLPPNCSAMLSLHH